jgi:hypothetical protein
MISNNNTPQHQASYTSKATNYYCRKPQLEFTGRKTNCFNWSKWNWEINLALTGIQKPLSGTIALNGKIFIK